MMLSVTVVVIDIASSSSTLLLVFFVTLCSVLDFFPNPEPVHFAGMVKNRCYDRLVIVCLTLFCDKTNVGKILTAFVCCINYFEMLYLNANNIECS